MMRVVPTEQIVGTIFDCGIIRDKDTDGGYASRLPQVNMEEELERYHLDGKWNDYIGVQKRVVEVLRREGFFEGEPIINKKTGMAIRITTKGIRETLGNGNRFQTLPREVKKYKIAALRKLPELIEIGDVTLDDVENIHCESGFHFAYIESEMIIDEIRVDVRISIKKRLNSNHFWIHKVDKKEKLRITHSILSDGSIRDPKF